jgi:hypothetical protein
MHHLRISMAAHSSFIAGRLRLWVELIPLYPLVNGDLTMEGAGSAFRYFLTPGE